MRRLKAAPLVLLSLPGVAGALELRLAARVSNLSPTEDFYDQTFLSPGTAFGGLASLDAPGPLGFDVGAEWFSKNAPADWDGEVRAVLVSVFPTAGIEPLPGLELFGGPGAVFVTGRYSGTDSYGRFVEADGSSVGFGLCAGAGVRLHGPLAARLDYRRAFVDIRTDSAVIDGLSTSIYPAEETDLGYDQFTFSLLLSVFGGRESLLGI